MDNETIKILILVVFICLGSIGLFIAFAGITSSFETIKMIEKQLKNSKNKGSDKK